MSWDIVIFNSKQTITDPASIEESLPEPTDFCGVLENRFSNIVRDGDHREIKGKDFSIDYFEDGEPASNRMFSLYGEDALYALLQISIEHGWQIFDTGSGEMIDLLQPEKNGYKEFQRYLQFIINKPDEP